MDKQEKKSSPADRAIYPFHTMKVGEEFFIPDAAPSFRAYVYHRAAVLGRRFTVRKETRGSKSGLVVERIAA